MDLPAVHTIANTNDTWRPGRWLTTLALVIGLSVVGLSGTAHAQQITLPGSPHDIGSVATGATLNATFNLSNVSGQPDLVITSITEMAQGGDDCTPFTVPAYSNTLAGGADDDVPVSFSTTTYGTYTCTVRVASNDTVAGDDEVTLQATALEPDIASDVPSVAFGDQPVGVASAAMVVTIENNGNDTLSITGVSVSGTDAADFVPTPGQMPTFTIAAGGTETVSIVFTPGAAGARSASLDIASDDPDTDPLQVPLSGTGIEPDIATDVPSVAFGDQPVGVASAAMVVTIENNGGATLTIDSIAISGTHAADFVPTPGQMPTFTIAAGGTETVSIVFTPGAAGARMASLDIGSDDPDTDPLQVPLSGTGIEPDIATDVPSVAFGDQPVGVASAAMVVTIENNGGATLTIDSIAVSGTHAADFVPTPGQMPTFTIAAGGTETVSIVFTPGAAGARTASLDIGSDDPDTDPLQVPLSGTGVQPDIAADLPSVDFGNQVVSTTSAPVVLTIDNNGTSDLTITRIALAGTDPGDFGAVPGQTPTFTIAAGGSETVSLTFAPTATGARSAVLEIDSNDPDTATLQVPLSGVGVVPDIAVDMAMIDFGDQVISTTSAPVILTIDNNGTSDLTITDIALAGTHPGDFGAVPGQTPTFTITAGGSETVSLTFTPSAAGTRSAILEIDSDDPDTATLQVPLSGNGLAPDIAADMVSVDFGNQLVGLQSGATVLTIENNGTSPLLITDISLSGAHTADFDAIPSMMPMFSIAAGDSETVSLTFTPSVLGARNAVLDISSDDPDTGVLSVPLMGTGAEPNISLDTNALDFGQILVSQTSAAQTVTIENTGGWPLQIMTAAPSGGAAADYAVMPEFTLAHTLQPAETMTVDVTFTPSIAGTRFTNLNITSDDPNAATSIVTLTGDGMEAPSMTLSQNTLDFGSVLIGNSTDLTFEIQNGTGPFRFDLDVSSITVNGDADFSVDTMSALVAPDGSQTVTVTFAPTAQGARMATIDIVSDDPAMGMQSVMVVGDGLSPDIDVDTATHDFGPIAVDFVSNQLTVTVSNNGNSDLTISSAALTGGAPFSLDTGNAMTTIMAGDMETWVITCRPTATGTFNDTFVFASDDPDSPSVSVDLSCEGIDDAIRIDPAATFPDTYINDTSQLSIDIISQNDSPITIDTITVTDAAYTVNATPPYTLNTVDDLQTITIDFNPLVAQDYNAMLQIDLGTKVVEFPVIGRGVVADMAVTTGGMPVPPMGHDFGSLAVFTSSVPQPFRLTSTGSFPVQILDVSIDDGNNFTLEDPTAGGAVVLIPGDFVEFNITANPQIEGTLTGEITVQTDIPGAMYVTFNVVVVGTTGRVEISPSELDFGAIDVQDPNLPVTQTITVTNLPTSSDRLEIDNVYLIGDPAFSLPPGQLTQTSLAIGESFDVVVEYHPLIETPADGGSLVISTDAADTPTIAAPLLGRGIDRHIQVSSMNVTFPETFRNPATPAEQTLVIQNTGDAPLDISMLVTGGPDASVFSLSNQVMQVAPMDSQDLVVSFAPDAVNAAYDATLTIVNDDDDRPMVEVTLGGAGVLPNVALVAGAAGTRMQTGQGVPLRLSELTEGPFLLRNMDGVNSFTVREIRVVGADGNPIADDVFRVVDLQPDTEVGPNQALPVDIELLSATPGSFQGTVEVYLDADPVRVAILDIEGDVLEIDLRGGCDATGEQDAGSLALVALALVLWWLAPLVRRRGRSLAGATGLAAVLLLALVGGLPAAHADNPRNLDLNTFRPLPSIEGDMLSVESAEVGDSGAWAIGVVVDHAVNPLTVRAVGLEDDVPIAGRTATGLMASFALLDRFEGGLMLPFLQQTGNMPTFSGIAPPEGTAIGDLTVHVKAAIARASALSFAVSTTVTVPTASDGMFAGVDGPTVQVRGIAGLSLSRLRLAVNAGARVRSSTTLGDATQGNALIYGLAAEFRMSSKVSAVGEVYGMMGLSAPEPAAVSPIESALGLRYRLNRAMSVRMGAGRGLSSGIGAPSLRGFLLLSYSPRSREIERFEKRRKLRPTPTDQDGDGVSDPEDKCPDEPEDLDLFEDKDGCPDWDNDKDGVDDSLDKCPLRAEDPDKFQDEDGCPDEDNDGDKIPDKDDKCPNEPEDMDGFEDIDGCDDMDNDSDGIPDVIDACVLEPETINGNNDEDGCPDEGDSLVMVMADRLELFEPVRFRGTGSKLTKKSEKVLQQIGAHLVAQTSILKVRITVHVHPSSGDDQARSDQRAEAVRSWLVKWGVAPERLETKGVGSDQPLVPRNQRGAKAINNRVEFIILEKSI